MSPLDLAEQDQYKGDLAFIYDAFQNARADSMNFYLIVEQNKRTKGERKANLDAKNYFRGILTENMDEPINSKLTHINPNGAEG